MIRYVGKLANVVACGHEMELGFDVGGLGDNRFAGLWLREVQWT